MGVLSDLNSKTLELRKNRDELAGSFQATQAQATAYAKERAIKDKADLATLRATDEDALRAIQRSIKQVRDTLSHKPDHQASLRELEILEGLLPRMASEDEIRGEVESYMGVNIDLPQGGKAMGAIMAHLNHVFGTSLDKGKASSVVREVLAG